jgi:3-dehydroquinate dehydratase-2
MADQKTIHILNGPNLNLLGLREPEIYGHDTLADIEARCRDRADALGYGLVFAQTNSEGELVSLIQQARLSAALIINPAAYTHTSVAMLDALKMVEGPVIELHLSNPHTREPFRHTSFASPAAKGIVAGFGAMGYTMALDAAAGLLAG